MDFSDLKFDDKGLIPAIVQEAAGGAVLMMAYMNRESLVKTLETGYTWFYSRSRQALWEKGSTSGNRQKVVTLRYDCDGDSLLVGVEQQGAACHTGEKSCFFRSLLDSEGDSPTDCFGPVMAELYRKLQERRENPQKDSYTNYLLDKGLDKILKKVGEESAEVIIAAKNNSREELIYETADLLYHLSVLLLALELNYEDIGRELQKRFK